MAEFERNSARARAPTKDLRNPIEAWPGELMFFFRVSFLLRGLAAVLGVRLPYLKLLSPFAATTLLKAVHPTEHATRIVHASAAAEGDEKSMVPSAAAAANQLLLRAAAVPTRTWTTLEERVRRIIIACHRTGQLCGVQLCAYQNGRPVLDVCGGTLGRTDPRPVLSSTLFNCFSVTKGVLVACFHAVAAARGVALDTPIAQLWPAFAASGKQDITIRQALCHQAGLAQAVTAKTPLTDICEWKKMVQLIADAKAE
jgi:CubicO group peptidase (beta-lactamase class C family)